jgi:outer membrane scaffolding protein for murein synthesis (MipA/OmpV family)
MRLRRHLASFALATAVLALGETSALAEDAVAETASAAEAEPEAAPQQPAPAAPAPAPFAFTKPVFDDTWVTIGLGAGLVPSYAGSNDYIAFPLPLIVGRVGGVGIRPNGPGLTLDLLSPKPGLGPRKSRLAFGPAFRIRNDRDAQIEDAVVERAGRLDLAVEAGFNGGVSFPGVLHPLDTLTVSAQARWDVSGAHEGMVIEPQATYAAPIGRAMLLQVQAGLEFVDDSFADYYFSVSPEQSAASGLPIFSADGGLNRISTFSILSYDLDDNALNGGWSVYGVGGYSRLLGDAADTPFTSERGSANQFIAGLGLGYTF